MSLNILEISLSKENYNLFDNSRMYQVSDINIS